MPGGPRSSKRDSKRGTLPRVELRGLSFRYPGAREKALRDIHLQIAAGERLGLLGPNGAGKSTLMRLICGYLPYRSEDKERGIWVDGIEVAKQPLQVRRRIGYLPEQVPVYPEMRVVEHLSFRAALKRIQRRHRLAEIHKVCEQVGLQDMLQTTIARLSRGYRQRVGIADALLGAPALVILDEPTIGLDPNQILEIRDVLMGLDPQQSLIFSSHILQDVEAICDRIAIMARGRLVADERVSENGPESLVVEWLGEVKGGAQAVLERALAKSSATANKAAVDAVLTALTVSEGRTTVVLANPVAGLSTWIGQESLAEGLVITRLEAGRARLEERFAQVTGFRGGWES